MKLRVALLLMAASFYSYMSAQKIKSNDTGGRKYDVAAFLYRAYASDDPRLRPFWPMGIGEWEKNDNNK